MFKAIVIDTSLSNDEKGAAMSESKEGLGLRGEDAAEELMSLLLSRCKDRLVNASADCLQGDEAKAFVVRMLNVMLLLLDVPLGSCGEWQSAFR